MIALVVVIVVKAAPAVMFAPNDGLRCRFETFQMLKTKVNSENTNGGGIIIFNQRKTIKKHHSATKCCLTSEKM